MNFKKFISGVSAFAIAASAFAGMAVTANAAEYTDVYTKSVADWTDADKADWGNETLNVDATNGLYFNPTKPGAAYSAKKTFNISENAKVKYDLTWYVGSSTGRDSNFEYIQLGDKIRISWNSNYYFYLDTTGTSTTTKSIGSKGSNTTYKKNIILEVDTASNTIETFTFDGIDLKSEVTAVSGDFDTITFGLQRGGGTSNWGYPNGITNITVGQIEQSVQTAAYTVKYLDKADDSNVKDDFNSTGVVGNNIVIDKTAFYNDSNKKYIYVSDDAAQNPIKDDGTTVVTVYYRAAETYSYSVTAGENLPEIASGSAYEGETVTVAYPRHINVDGTLYLKNATNNVYKTSFNLTENNQVVDLGYASSAISDVVYFSEAEYIDGLTPSKIGNVDQRSSNANAAYSTEDVVITTLEPGKYIVSGVEYINANAGGYLNFTAGNTSFKVGQVAADFENGRAATNWKDFSSEEITITESTDLKVNSDNNTILLDYIYVVKTGDVDPSAEAGEVTDVVTYSGDQYDGSATSASVAVSYANMLADKKITLTYKGTTKDVNGATGFTGNGNITVGVVIQNIADANPVFTAGVE